MRHRVPARAGLLAMLALALAACGAGDFASVDGWRPLTAVEMRDLMKERAANDPMTPPIKTSVWGDFNGDGARDRALFLLNAAGDRFEPYVLHGGGGAPDRLAPGDTRDRLWRYQLATMPGRSVYGFCMEESPDEESCNRFKTVQTPVIIFFEVNNGGSIYYWQNSYYTERRIRKG